MERNTPTEEKTKKNAKAKKIPAKTIKSVLCSPTVHWPLLNREQGEKLLSLIRRCKIEDNNVKKLPWSQLKNLAKEERPKVNNVYKHPFFSFGISECSRLLKKKKCQLIIIDADVKPRVLVTHIIGNALNSFIPVVCVPKLASVTLERFKFKSICIAVKEDSTDILPEVISNFIKNLSKNIEFKQKVDENEKSEEIAIVKTVSNESAILAVENTVKNNSNTYLTRTDKSVRIFIPNKGKAMKTSNDFGAEFIKVESSRTISKIVKPNNSFWGAHLKRIHNNSNRKRKN